MVKYNLLAIHQDSFVQQEQDNFVHPDVDGEKISSSNVKDEQIFDMKNELANIDKHFTEVKQYVAESVKTILNELRSAGIKSDEFNEDRNDSRSVDDLLQTPHGSKICEEISNEPINVKDELSRDMDFDKDAPLPSETPAFKFNPTVVIPHSTSNPVLNIFVDQHYAPDPTFKSIDPYDCTKLPEFSPNTEKPVMTEEQEKMARKLRSLELTMKNFQGLGGYKSVSYKDLCKFPGVHLRLGFKMPKFEKYDGHGDPIAHLRCYCNQLRGAGGKEELLMAYFSESLSGLASKLFVDQDIDKWNS
ncbi:hypothetical protein T459_20739 [Capsicum annuum]|uniref:Uncharacterized protein n=1 Tax=Capsicum annuum TaxID=4072 RepID=A0A2G2Z5D1_CAPAN|nr:hypothetical protein T459_20739 [Capsicum annuum]